MATYNRTADLTCDAYVLGAGSPDSWYTAFVADGTILEDKPAADQYLIGTLTGWVPAVVGDYVIYTAAAGGAPKSVAHMSKADFEATYELDEE